MKLTNLFDGEGRVAKLIALITVVCTAIGWMAGLEIPDPWWIAFGLVMAFFFRKES